MTTQWTALCAKSDLVENSGVAALLDGEQIALFYLPNSEEQVFAVSNHDPFSNAYVLSRGIVGDLKGEWVVASPIYKQHFVLNSGVCQEDEEVKLKTWPVRLNGDTVEISA